MARYQIVFRNETGGRHTLLVDDSTPERLSHLRQPFELGARLSTNGKTWMVVDELMHDGLRSFICNPVTHVSHAPQPVAGMTGEGGTPRPARIPLRLVASAASPPA
jgi:hypothetical protein